MARSSENAATVGDFNIHLNECEFIEVNVEITHDDDISGGRDDVFRKRLEFQKEP